MSVVDRLVTTIHINKDKGIVWKEGEFNTSFLLNDNYYFKVAEDDIDIQSIEELKEEDFLEYDETELDWREKLEIAHLNKMLQAIKQLDRKMNK